MDAEVRTDETTADTVHTRHGHRAAGVGRRHLRPTHQKRCAGQGACRHHQSRYGLVLGLLFGVRFRSHN